MKLIEMAVSTGAIGIVPGYAGQRKLYRGMSLAKQREQFGKKKKKKIEEAAHSNAKKV